jgi:hypothetical protein
MDASIAEPAVLDRIGLSLDDVVDDVLTEPLPKYIKELLALCALSDVLADHLPVDVRQTIVLAISGVTCPTPPTSTATRGTATSPSCRKGARRRTLNHLPS